MTTPAGGSTLVPPAGVLGLPPRLTRLVGWVSAVGVVSVLVALSDADGLAARPHLWELVVATVAFFLGELALLHIRFGHDHQSFTWSEASVVVGLVLLPTPWLVLVGAASVAAAHAVTRRAPVKVLFNALSFATAVLLARLAYGVAAHLLGSTDPHDPRTWLALAAGTLAFFGWNASTIAAAVAASQGLPAATVYRKGLVLNLLVLVGNTATGVSLVAVAASQPLVVVVFPFFLVLLYLADRGYLRALKERDTWQVLQAASADLIRVDQAGVAEVVLERAASLFGAEFVELMLVDGEPGTVARVFRRAGGGGPTCLEGDPIGLAGSFWPRAFSEREPFEIVAGDAPMPQRVELEALGLAMCVVAPLPARDRCLGTLRVGFRGVVRMDARERQVLATFANHVTASVGHARLFEEMNEERAKLSRVVDTSSDGILSIDGSGCVTSWNRAMAEMTGVATSEAVGAPLFLGLEVREEDGTRLTVEGLLDRLAGVDHFELAVAVGGDSPRWLHLSVSAVRTAAGETDLAVVVARDVTARRELEEAKQDFIATVSHELRTPLTPLKGFLLTLLRPDYKVGEEELRVHHRRMLHNAERLERLIEDLLSVSQIDQGVLSVCAEPVNVDEAVEKALGGVSGPVEHHRAGMAGTAVADAVRVEQVVANLVGNAEKYAAGGPVVVTVERDGDTVVVKVRDEGPGIPEGQHEAIFRRFHRLGHHLTRRTGGTGLGLYIARHLVEAMGGRIWVESQPGAGATFAFTLPAAPLVAALQAADSLSRAAAAVPEGWQSGRMRSS